MKVCLNGCCIEVGLGVWRHNTPHTQKSLTGAKKMKDKANYTGPGHYDDDEEPGHVEHDEWNEDDDKNYESPGSKAIRNSHDFF